MGFALFTSDAEIAVPVVKLHKADLLIAARNVRYWG